MAVVTMRKGDRFADIFDSPETIAQAQRDGYHICTDDEVEAREALNKADEVLKANKAAGDKLGKGILSLSKTKLIDFANEKGIFEDAFSKLKKEDLAQKLIEVIKAKIVEAGLKTADEASSLAEDDLIALFDSIGKKD